MKRLARPSLCAVLLLAAPGAARAHHGVAAVSVAGPEGPGAALETTSPLPLPQGTFFAMAKSEYVPFRRLSPGPKTYSLFNMAALGFGIRPWLSAYVFQPFNVKSTDGEGRNSGVGDTSLMLSFGFKYDEGFRLVPEKESLDELMDWHFSFWAATTLPVGPTERFNGVLGEAFAPDMQTGFGSMSPSLGIAALKQLTDDLTWLGEVNYQHFFPHDYSFTRYQFGGETRVNTALVYRAYGAGKFRLDVAGELNGLHLQRDKELEAGNMESLTASGGGMIYAGIGTRLTYGPLSAGLGVRRAFLKDLNEEADQQGAEGLERLRASFTLSYSTRF